nr:hypothetical protein [Massilia sp. JS1662]
MRSSILFEVLAGLPGDGPVPLAFSVTGLGRHQEGFVVKFMPHDGAFWVGNFQSGLTSFYLVLDQNNGAAHLVIAGGQGYLVDTRTGRLLSEFGGSIEWAQVLADDETVLTSNGLSFTLLKGAKTVWQTRRLSWDGVRAIRLTSDRLIGEGWCFDETWHPFEVNLANGDATGGGYTGHEK